MQADFEKLKPLNPGGLKGFSTFRDPNEKSNTNGNDKAAKKRQKDADSDDEEADAKKEVLIRTEGDDMQDANGILSAEDAQRQAELAQGVQKIRVSSMSNMWPYILLIMIQLKRQHSADPIDSPSPAPANRASSASHTPTTGSTPPHLSNDPPVLLPNTAYDGGSARILEEGIIGSPLKKQRASLSGIEEQSLRSKFGLGLTGAQGDVLGRIEQERGSDGQNVGPTSQDRLLFGDSLGSIAQEKVDFGERLASEKPQQATRTEDMEEEL